MRPILPWSVPCVRKRTPSHGSKKRQTLSHKGFFHISGTMPEPSRPQVIEDNRSRAKSPAGTNSPRTSRLSPVPQSGLWRALPSIPVTFYFFPKCCLSVLGHKNLSPVIGRLHFPKGSRFLTFIWLPYSRCPAHFFVVLVQFFPVSAFNTFCRSPGKKACQTASTKGGPHLSSAM